MEKLEVLFLDNNDLGISAVSALVDHAPLSLRKVSFAKNPIGEEAGIVLGRLMTHPKFFRLGVIDFRETKMWGQGARKLAEFAANISHARQTRRIRELDLSGNGISAVGMEALVPVFSKLVSVSVLCLGGNAIDHAGAKHFAGVVSQLQNLSKLVLSDNDLDAEGIAVLMPSIHDLPHLKELDVSGNNLGEGMEVFLDEITTMSQLERVTFEHEVYAKSSQEGMQRMKELRLKRPNLIIRP
eukprot:TRINITY_DN59818_c0_g1_i2.p1 TRINITY_DN59818_c0_g1~~TRINITY_DN59818_c0_g1_i2.p1  ORF type:complete len:241 (+),score=48.56 TRINITY_DN59818_c0_g1_i2:444-1166(+)